MDSDLLGRASAPFPPPGARPSLAAALLALAGVMGGCEADLRPGYGPFGEELVLVRAPEPPAAWAGLEGLRFRLEYPSAGGGGEAWLLPGEERALLIARGEGRSLLAYPTWLGEELRPAGALYPEGVRGGEAGGGPPRLELGYQGGFLALLRSELSREGFDPRAVDLVRLGRELGLRVEDPWSLDRARLLSSLSGGSFRVSSLRRPPEGEALVPGPGPHVPDSPFAPPAEALSDGTWRLRGAVGARVFLCPEGRRVRDLRRPRRRPRRRPPRRPRRGFGRAAPPEGRGAQASALAPKGRRSSKRDPSPS